MPLLQDGIASGQSAVQSDVNMELELSMLKNKPKWPACWFNLTI